MAREGTFTFFVGMRQTLPFRDINQAGAFMPSVNLGAPSISHMGLKQLREDAACLKAPRNSGKGIGHRVDNFQSYLLTLF